MIEHRVDTWNELHELLFADSWQESLGRFRSDFAYRGVASGEDDLRTSLVRLGGEAATLEGHLVRNFRKYAGAGAVPQDTIWNWLALGKHHGLPTRLLDWTYSPYVALHFATADWTTADTDSVVWTVDYVRAHAHAPAPLRAVLEREGANVFTTEMLAGVAAGPAELPDGAGDAYVLFFEPPSFDARIVNQYALFSLASRADVGLADWAAAHSDLVRKIVIPAALRWEVRDKLDQANVTERVLFPGLDGLSRWIARYYAPRP